MNVTILESTHHFIAVDGVWITGRVLESFGTAPHYILEQTWSVFSSHGPGWGWTSENLIVMSKLSVHRHHGNGGEKAAMRLPSATIVFNCKMSGFIYKMKMLRSSSSLQLHAQL